MSEKRSVQATGETIEAAISAGLAELGVNRDDVKVAVIDEGSRGVLGIGKRDAIVELALLDFVEAVHSDPPPESEPKTVPVAEPAPELPVEDQNGVAPSPPVEDEIDDSIDYDAEEEDNEEEDGPIVQDQESLEREAEAAEEIVTNLLDMMGIDADVSVEIAEEDDLGIRVPMVRVTGDDLSGLIGQRGTVLNDFQFIARTMASQKMQGRTSFVIDVDGYREKRTETLMELARRTADKAIRFRRPIALNPMPPHERRVIHMALRDDKRVSTSSKGEGKRRRVRIIPKGGRPRGRSSSGGRNNRRRQPSRS